MMNFFDVELFLDFFAAVLNIQLVGVDLREDEIDVGAGGFDESFVLSTLDEIIEVGSQFEEIGPGLEALVKLFHLMIGFFAEEEQSYLMISIDSQQIVDIWSHELEDKHYIVSLV